MGRVIGSVRRELVDLCVDPIKQRPHLRGIVCILIGQALGDDLAAVGVERQMELAPSPAQSGAVLVFQPLTGALDLQSGAVDQHMQRAVRRMVLTSPGEPRLPCLRPAAQRRMIGNRQVKTHQIEQREHQPLALA